jgi:predicted ferric reductase
MSSKSAPTPTLTPTSHNDDGSSTKTSILLQVLTACRQFLRFLALVLALAPSVLKMYETSHWFRSEDDPSPYDQSRDWFEVTRIPYAKIFDHHDKTLMRVYFFIVPYILSAFCLATAHVVNDCWIKSIKNRTLAYNGVATSSPRSLGHLLLRSLLEQTWQVPQLAKRFLWAPKQVSTAELLGIAAYLVVNVGTFAVRVKRSLPRGTRKLHFLEDMDEDRGKEEIPFASWEACEIWAKTLGILAILNLGWYLILPIGRRSVMLEALCLSWERAVKYHRWIGYYTMLLTLGHGVMYVGVWIHGNGSERFDPDGLMIQHNLVPWGCSARNEEGVVDSCDDRTAHQLRVNFYGFAAFFLMMIMTVFALPWIRRAHFEWFYYTHHIFPLVLFFMGLHYRGAFIYLIPGVAMYSVDKLFPLFAYRSAGTVRTKLVSPDVLEIRIPTRTQEYYGGSYVFLNVPSVSWLEWHPYSLTSAPREEGQDLVFHLKGAGTWTRAVIEEALKAKANGSDLTVRIDGFYGPPLVEALAKKDSVVLVGGGIGITPMVSIARDMAAKAPHVPVSLLWVVKTTTEYGVLSNELEDLMRQSSPGKMDVRVWVTLSQPEPSVDEPIEIDVDTLGAEQGKAITFLTKDISEALCDESQVDSLLSNLSAIRIRRPADWSRSVSPSYLFVQGGFQPATNALVMGLSIVVGLSSYALTWHLGETNEIEPADKLGLLHMFMCVLWILSFIAFVGVVRKVILATQPTNTPSAGKDISPGKDIVLDQTARLDASERTDKDPEKGVGVTSFHSNSSSSNSTVYTTSDDSREGHAAMLKGRIGFRPNLAFEFGKITTSGDHTHKDVGVLACGPLAMVQSITQICNKPRSGCQWGMQQDDGTNVFFSFTEEDWEW